MEAQQENKRPQGNTLFTLCVAVKLAYKQYKSDLKYIKTNSNIWKGKTYLWGRTHLSVARHWFHWMVIKR